MKEFLSSLTEQLESAYLEHLTWTESLDPDRSDLSSADMFYGDADVLFQQDLAPAHSAKTKPNGSLVHMLLLCWIGWETPLYSNIYCMTTYEHFKV